MQHEINSIKQQSSDEEIREASHKMWEYLYGKWTWKNGQLPFDPFTFEKLAFEPQPELAKLWNDTNVQTMRAWSDNRASWSNEFDWKIDSFGEQVSVTVELARMQEHIEARREREAKAIALSKELEQIEQAGGRQMQKEWSNRRWAIEDFNSKIESLRKLYIEIEAKQLAIAEKKAERKAARLARKAEQTA